MPGKVPLFYAGSRTAWFEFTVFLPFMFNYSFGKLSWEWDWNIFITKKCLSIGGKNGPDKGLCAWTKFLSSAFVVHEFVIFGRKSPRQSSVFKIKIDVPE